MPTQIHHPSKVTTVGVLIRFKNSAETLPEVLAALQAQSRLPDVILGVDSGSHDDSANLIRRAGGQVIHWSEPYQHSKVLNFGASHLQTDLVLVLSSHTVLEDKDTLARMVDALNDPQTACVSLKWDSDPFYSDTIDWQELQTKGLKFGSIYSNSMGMFRRRLWERQPFHESLDTSEDYAWAIDQLQRGDRCRRLALPFRYRRSGHNRDYEFAHIVFRFARQHRLPVAWLGLRATLTAWLKALWQADAGAALHRARCGAFFTVLISSWREAGEKTMLRRGA
jgi:glycosyltransferase involved in cell wall biosynthesis